MKKGIPLYTPFHYICMGFKCVFNKRTCNPDYVEFALYFSMRFVLSNNLFS